MDTQTPLPTRVIDVGTSSIDVRLYVSKREDGQYAALSHRWGNSKPVITTKSTLESHQSGLQLDERTKTFADAVEVTRQLGIRYLWIDSLCIIQDDEQDWISESAKMSDIYRHATLTLSADGAKDVSSGLLGSPAAQTSSHKVHSFIVDDKDDHPTTVHARLCSAPPSNPNSFPHSSLDPEPSVLSTRGWVVQERILSPRMVHFHQEELVWSCYSQQRCECRLLPGASATSRFGRLLASKNSAADLLLEWPPLVSQFTSKDLSFAKDRLPAISGLATLMSQHTSSQYLAGLWANDLDYSLLWMSDHQRAGSKPVQRIDVEPYAPSWSWASIIGPVKYIPRHLDQFSHRRSGGDEVQTVYKILRAAAIPLTKNIYGPIKHGFVTAAGQVLPIFYDPARKVWRPEAKDFDLSRLSLDDEPPHTGIDDPRIEPECIFDVLSEYSPEYGPRDGIIRGYALLRVATYIWKGQWSTESTEVVALFLSQVSIDPPAYRRRGAFLHAFDSKKVWEDVPTSIITLC